VLPALLTLSEEEQRLLARFVEGGRCLCGRPPIKVYRRPLGSSSTRVLLSLYRQAGLDWSHIPTISTKLEMQHGGYAVLAQHWGLMEEETAVKRADGGRAGFWRVTPKGERWINGEETVPKYATLYIGQLLKNDGPPWSVEQALGKKFNLREIMGHA
jgi:hypothetical protein